MLDFIMFLLLAALIGAVPLWPLFARMRRSPLREKGRERFTVKETVVDWGLEGTAFALLLEASKGLLVSLVALNFWENWQWVASVGTLEAVMVQRYAYRKFVTRGQAVFCGGLLLIHLDIFRLFLALWLSLLILLRNSYWALVVALITVSALMIWLELAPGLLLLFAGYLGFLVLDPAFKLGKLGKSLPF